MMFVMPIMYLWFGYIMPAGMCVYMAFNAIFMAIQELICARILRGKYAEMEAARQKRIEEEKERERLFALLTRLVKWENSKRRGRACRSERGDHALHAQRSPGTARPLCRRRSIPLEAQRSG